MNLGDAIDGWLFGGYRQKAEDLERDLVYEHNRKVERRNERTELRGKLKAAADLINAKDEYIAELESKLKATQSELTGAYKGCDQIRAERDTARAELDAANQRIRALEEQLNDSWNRAESLAIEAIKHSFESTTVTSDNIASHAITTDRIAEQEPTPCD